MINDSNDKKILLAKKLYELAQRGIGGEKLNAEEKLTALMEKYKIKFEDLETDHKHEYNFKYKSVKHRKFILQVASSVIGRIQVYKENTRFKEIKISMTSFEHLEVAEKMEFYWKLLNEEEKIFYSAFIQRQHLYQKPDGNDDDDIKPMTEKERQDLMRMMQMMAAIEVKTPVKKLSEFN